MARAKATTVTKSYEGDLEVGGGDDFWSAIQQAAFVIMLVGVGWFVSWWW